MTLASSLGFIRTEFLAHCLSHTRLIRGEITLCPDTKCSQLDHYSFKVEYPRRSPMSDGVRYISSAISDQAARMRVDSVAELKSKPTPRALRPFVRRYVSHGMSGVAIASMKLYVQCRKWCNETRCIRYEVSSEIEYESARTRLKYNITPNLLRTHTISIITQLPSTIHTLYDHV
jgi:hypothetical protein